MRNKAVSATELAKMAKCERLVLSKGRASNPYSAKRGIELHDEFDKRFSKTISEKDGKSSMVVTILLAAGLFVILFLAFFKS